MSRPHQRTQERAWQGSETSPPLGAAGADREGRRRTHVCRLFLEPALAPEKWGQLWGWQ